MVNQVLFFFESIFYLFILLLVLNWNPQTKNKHRKPSCL